MAAVGCVPYLNAYPLIARCPSDVQVVFDVPSRLPALLDQQAVQAILVSSIESFRLPGARVAMGASISTQGEVKSVRLFSKVPFSQIRSLALDQSSMTSNALAQILLAEKYGVKPAVGAMPPDLDGMLEHHDAGVLIGDIGMRTQGEGLHILDLGACWTETTGLPFVWAVWLGQERLTPSLAEQLVRAKEQGVAELSALITQAVSKFGFDESTTQEYLTRVMDYDFEESHRRGLQEFGRRCVELRLLAEAPVPEWIPLPEVVR